ncbi:MAG TPA: SlyX family protein [Woeseiaceae bacterium]|nr:SlyX family protein [Woeseiaceae bacterium]
MDDQRLIEIETKLAYQEQAVHELNQVLTAQQDQLTQLRQRLMALGERLESLAEAPAAAAIDDERPPHY